jgi:hypothetical protein
MSKKNQNEEEVKSMEQEEKVEEAAEEKTATKEGAEGKTMVYCGPSIRGVARQYTVFSEEIPETLAEFINEHPAVKALLVTIEKFPQTRKNLETKGTAEAILYKKIKSEL